MTIPTCRVPTCDKPSPDGPACTWCLRRLTGHLRSVPWLAQQLEVTRSGLGRVVAGGKRQYGQTALGYRPRATEVYDALVNTLSTWVRDLWETSAPYLPTCSLCGVPGARHAEGPALAPRDWPLRRAPLDAGSSPASLATWLLRHHRWITRHEAADELVREVYRCTRAALRVIDALPDEETFGICDMPLDADGDTRCEAYLYGRNAAATDYVTCRACGTHHEVRVRQEWMRQALEDTLFTAAELARVMPRLIGRPLSANTVRSWGHQHRIKAHRYDDGATLYRTGDVLTLALTTPTRRRRKSAPKP